MMSDVHFLEKREPGYVGCGRSRNVAAARHEGGKSGYLRLCPHECSLVVSSLDYLATLFVSNSLHFLGKAFPALSGFESVILLLVFCSGEFLFQAAGSDDLEESLRKKWNKPKKGTSELGLQEKKSSRRCVAL